MTYCGLHYDHVVQCRYQRNGVVIVLLVLAGVRILGYINVWMGFLESLNLFG